MDIILKGTKADIARAMKKIQRKNRAIGALAEVYSLVNDACITYLCEEGAGLIAARSRKPALMNLAMRAGGALLGLSLSDIASESVLAGLENLKLTVVDTVEIDEEEEADADG